MVEVQMPGRGRTAKSHYGEYRAELAKSLPAGEFDDLAGHLKERGSPFGQWTVDENVTLFKIVKKVEQDRASAPVGGKRTSTFWEAVAAAVEVQMQGRGANK